MKKPTKKMSGGGMKPAMQQSGGKPKFIQKKGDVYLYQKNGKKVGIHRNTLGTRTGAFGQPELWGGMAAKHRADAAISAPKSRKPLPADAPEQEALAQQRLAEMRRNKVRKMAADAKAKEAQSKIRSSVSDIKSGKADYKKYLPKKKKGGTSKMRKK